MKRLFVGILALVVFLATAAVIAAMRPMTDPGVNLIAFVNVDGEVMTMQPDGLGVRQISPDVEGFFTWPTWSPDANSLVYSGVVDDEGELQINLYASDNAGGGKRVVYASGAGASWLTGTGCSSLSSLVA